eukprot:scaffold3680_cov65-Cylindrotheca_fusiformis.AAC.3
MAKSFLSEPWRRLDCLGRMKMHGTGMKSNPFFLQFNKTAEIVCSCHLPPIQCGYRGWNNDPAFLSSISVSKRAGESVEYLRLKKQEILFSCSIVDIAPSRLR